MTEKERRQLLKARRASKSQAVIEDEMALLEMARRRMGLYSQAGYPVPNLEETMKYSMRRDPSAERYYKEGVPIPLPENIPTNFVAGLGNFSVQKPNPSGTRYRIPDTTANYVRNPDLSTPIVNPHYRRLDKRKRFDTININKEMVSGRMGRPIFNITASDKEQNPALNFPLDPRYGGDNVADMRMHERMHKAYDYAFRSPFFTERRGKFLGGAALPKGHRDADVGKQVDYNKSIARGRSAYDKLHSREHDMIYSATTPGDRYPTPYMREDTRNFVNLIGKAYGEYDKESGQYMSRNPGLAAIQLEAYRRGITEKEMYCEVYPDEPQCRKIDRVKGFFDRDPDTGA
jgi:hypothetical protein